MNNEEWYSGAKWDKETQDFFEDKLKRSRGSYNKAQYLRIKASYLLKSGESFKESEGCKLMERIIIDFPNEISNVMFAYEQLGDYYYTKGKYEEAEFNYRQSVSFYKENGRSGTSGIGDIKLAETIFNTNQSDKFSEMYYLLTTEFKKNGGVLLLNEDIFKYYAVLAKISDALRKKSEAKQYAEKALQLSERKEPQLDKYPELGVIRIHNEELNILKAILQE
jgi:tetratricopeptide (TPR) repeat protein